MTSKAAGLFQNAVAEGMLSKAAVQALNVNDIGTDINAALGVHIDDVQASEVTLVTMLVDDSGSIRMGGNAQLVRDGHNLVLKSLRDSKQKGGVLIMTRYLNGTVLYPYSTLDQVPEMDSHNFNPNGGTPLYDESITTLGTVVAKNQESNDSGVPCRGVSLIVSDGADMHSRRSAGDVKKIVDDMLKAENHIIAFMGIDDGSTDFRAVAESMGIKPEWVLTPGNTDSEIRRAFAVFSQSAVRASQSAGAFSQQAMGGFGSP